MTRLRLGACLSLTGRYARFGRQAADGLKAWQALAGSEVDLRVEDDGSDTRRVASALEQVAADCDILLGPYSTQLMREAGRVMEHVDKLLWNHGGSGDDVQALCPGRVVSVLSPTSRYAQPFVRARLTDAASATLWVVRGRGRFGRQVAAGALREASVLGLEAIEKDAREEDWLDHPPEVWDLFSVGAFEDDVSIVNKAMSVPTPPRMLCSVAAGVRDFTSVVERSEGIYGIAQWFPGSMMRPELGPPQGEFVGAYRRIMGSWPDYPAVQAGAAAVLAIHCAHSAGSVDPQAIWQAATSLSTTTLYGAFEVDTQTGAQIEHTPVLLRWRAGELELAT